MSIINKKFLTKWILKTQKLFIIIGVKEAHNEQIYSIIFIFFYEFGRGEIVPIDSLN